MTVVVDQQSTLCQVHKAGGVPLTDAQLQECIRIAQTRVPILLTMMQ